MFRLLKKYNLAGVIASILLVCTVIGVFSTASGVTVYADSNNLRKTYIQLMSGASAVNVDDIESLTVDDLRCIALYLSNFYVPFCTALDDTENKEQNIQYMVNSLKAVGFKDETARVLIDTVYTESLSSAQQIYFASSEVSGRTIEGDTGVYNFDLHISFDGDPEVFYSADTSEYQSYVGNTLSGSDKAGASSEFYPATMLSFLFMAQSARPYSYDSDNVDVPFNFYWNNSSNMTPCFQINSFIVDFLAAYLQKNTLDTNGNAGNAVLNTTFSDWDTNTDKGKAALCSFTQKLYVDWVGNIICDFGDKRVIIIPACLNPYAFGLLSDDGLEPRCNLVSTWGQWLFSNYCKENVFDTDSVGERVINFKAVRGSSKEASWKDKAYGSDSNDKVVKDFLEKTLSIKTGWGNWNHHDLQLTTSALAFSAENSISQYLVYKAVANNKIDSISPNTNFLAVDYLTSDTVDRVTDTAKFSSLSTDFSSYMNFSKGDSMVFANYFLSYAFAYANKDQAQHTCTEGDGCYVNYKFNKEYFPASSNTAIVWESLNTDTEKITSFIYYLLHPTEGARYITTWFKSKVGSILIGWHEDVVGGTDSNSTTGMTQYLNFTGYVTSPSLGEISWVSRIIDKYDNMVVFFILAISLLLVCYVLTGYMTVQRGIIGLLVFAVLAHIPPIAINLVTDSINNACDTIYSNKFDYWSYTQLQTYIGQLSNAVNANSVNDYISALMDLSGGSAGEATTGFAGVKLKWMTPKKIAEMDGVSDEMSSSRLKGSFSAGMISLLTNSLSVTNATESYTDNIGATYLYRDFTDIFMYGSSTYNIYTSFNRDGDLLKYTRLRLPEQEKAKEWTDGNVVTRSWGTQKDSVCRDIKYSSGMNLDEFVKANVVSGKPNQGYLSDTSSIHAMYCGFLNNTVGVDSKGAGGLYTHEGGLATSLLLGYSAVPSEVHRALENFKSKVASNEIKIAKNGLGFSYNPGNYGDKPGEGSINVFGLDIDYFKYSLLDFQTKGVNPIYSGGWDENIETEEFTNLSGLYYALYAESPYYYFNYAIRDFVSTAGSNYSYNPNALGLSTGNVHDLLLRNNQEFFYNLTENAGSGYGELRDFMNMHDLFYYIIPMLDEGNQLADLWDDYFGMYVNDDMSLRVDNAGNIWYSGKSYKTIQEMHTDGVFEEMTDEQLYKFWHDLNVWLIFNTYVPWLDTMEDCRYAKPEKIRVMGESYTVLNPLDPTSYFQIDDAGNVVAGRYMVFSRSEMAYYGLDLTDLTSVERKIIKVQDNVYKTSIDLMNYYILSDEVLINAFAMIQTFEFNKEFSESNLLGSSYILYPQGYEAKAFSYDAYLRLVISEASGDPLQVKSTDGETSIYRRVIKNTSLFFGIFLLINDVVAVYIIPCLKVAFLIMLFFVSIALICAASIKLELNLVSVIWRSIFAPLGSYFLVSVGFAWLVSLFMSNGASGVTETSSTISVGDPTTVIIIMIVINVAVMIMYFKICKKCFKDLKTYVSSVLASMAAAVVGGLSKMGKTLVDGPAAMRRSRNFNNVSGGVSANPKSRGRGNTHGLVPALAGAAGVHALSKRSQNAKQNGLNPAGTNRYNRLSKGANQPIQPKKSRYEKTVQSLDKATERAGKAKADAYLKSLDGKAAFHDSSRGLRNRIAGGKDFLMGSMSHGVASAKYKAVSGVSSNVRKVGTAMHNAGESIDKATGNRISRVTNFIYGTKENRGLTNAQINERNRRQISNLQKKSQMRGKGGSFSPGVFKNIRRR